MACISYIIPAYNVEKYINKCLDSIICQSLEDIEIICIDDGSTDNTRYIILEYANIDNRIKVIYHETNKGTGYSRNDGIKNATGKYIVFIDADDYVDNLYEKIYQKASKIDADICFYKFRDIYGEDEVIRRDNGKIRNSYPGVYNGKELLRHFINNGEFFYYSCMSLFKRTFLVDNDIFFSNLNIGEGGEFMLKNMLSAKTICVCDDVVYNYVQRSNSVTHSDDVNLELLLGQIRQYLYVLSYAHGQTDKTGISDFLNYQKLKIHGGISKLKESQKEYIDIKLKDVYEKHILDLLIDQNSRYSFDFSEHEIEMIKSSKSIIIYGAGYATADLIRKIDSYNCEIIGIAVANKHNNPETILCHHVYSIEELKQYNDSALVIVAANKKYNDGIRNILNSLGFNNVIFTNITI